MTCPSLTSPARKLMRLLLATAALMLPMAAAFAAPGTGPLATGVDKMMLAAPAGKHALVPKAGGVVEVVEFYNAGLDHYFISADPAEIAVLDGGAFGGAWKRTGSTFPAWDVNGAPGNTVPVCRFFGTDQYRANGSRIGPNSHFYTADPAECAFVKTAWQSVAANGISYPAWSYETNAFAVVLPVGGACPAGTQPVYRTYNDGARGDPNHRYSLNAGQLQAMAGWSFEGLVMCVPQGATSTLPPTMGACGADCPPGTPLGNGVGLVNIVVQIVNTSSGPLEVVIPAGQTFIATPVSVQNGIALERLQATVAPGATRTLILRMFCANASRSASDSESTYAPGPITSNPNLLELAALADGRLGPVADPLQIRESVMQSAVWEITDGPGALTATQHTLLTAIMSAPSTDPALPDLLLQFLATLSI
jgi:hypothetical protein